MTLTERETRILHLIAEGMSRAEIGQELYLSPLTVKTHAQRLYRKLEARGGAHAVHLAWQGRILGPSRRWPTIAEYIGWAERDALLRR